MRIVRPMDTSDIPEAMTHISAAYTRMAIAIDKALPADSRHRRMAMERLDESLLWATAGITNREPGAGPVTPRGPRSEEPKGTF